MHLKERSRSEKYLNGVSDRELRALHLVHDALQSLHIPHDENTAVLSNNTGPDKRGELSRNLLPRSANLTGDVCMLRSGVDASSIALDPCLACVPKDLRMDPVLHAQRTEINHALR